jgi:hypothetical protein
LKFYHFEFRGEFKHVDMQCAIYDHVHGVMSMFIKLIEGDYTSKRFGSVEMMKNILSNVRE